MHVSLVEVWNETYRPVGAIFSRQLRGGACAYVCRHRVIFLSFGTPSISISVGYLITRLKEKLGNVGGVGGGDKEGAGGEEAENEFVRASKEKFSDTQKALDENSIFVKMK